MAARTPAVTYPLLDSSFAPREEIRAATNAEIVDQQLYVVKQKSIILSECYTLPILVRPADTSTWYTVATYYLDGPDWCGLQNAGSNNISARWNVYAYTTSGTGFTFDVRITNNTTSGTSTCSGISATTPTWNDAGSDMSNACTITSGTENQFTVELKGASGTGAPNCYVCGISLMDTSGV